MQVRLENTEEFENERDMFYEWGSYLLDTFGYNGSQRVLSTYEDLGWISREVREEMEDVLMSSEIQANTEYELPDIDWPPLSSLMETEFEQHGYSVYYIIELSDKGEFSE